LPDELQKFPKTFGFDQLTKQLEKMLKNYVSGFGQAEPGCVHWVSDSSQFNLVTKLSQMMVLTLKVVKNETKIINLKL